MPNFFLRREFGLDADRLRDLGILSTGAVIPGALCALAIGHPFPSTLAALKDSLPWLKQQKVEIVFVSEILE